MSLEHRPCRPLGLCGKVFLDAGEDVQQELLRQAKLAPETWAEIGAAPHGARFDCQPCGAATNAASGLVAAGRRRKRGGPTELYDADAFQRRVAAGYADAPQWRAADLLAVIDGDASVRAVQRACRRALEELCPIR